MHFPRLRPPHLIGLTLAYWAGVAVAKLSTPLLIAWRLTHLPPGSSQIDAGWAKGLLTVNMLEHGSTVWSGSTTLGTVLLWLCAGPAVLIGAWWIQKKSESEYPEEDSSLSEGNAVGELPASKFEAPANRTDEEKLRARRRES